jgi:uncharacterized repeat protein (TIGR02543 family)
MPNFDSSTGAKIGGGFIYIDESPQPYYSPGDVARRQKSLPAEESTFADDLARRSANNSAVFAEAAHTGGAALKTKKIAVTFLSVILLAAVVLSAALWAAGFFGKKYKVVFLNDGAVYAEAEFKDGEELKLPPAPEKEGYVFGGWVDKDGGIFADGAVINSDLTLNAKWIEESFAVVFMVDGERYAEKTVVKGGELTLPDAPEKDGYVFGGWVDKDGGIFADGAVINSDLTLNAKWTEESFAVVFMVDGERYAEKTVVNGGELTLPAAPEKEGFTFDCWLYGDGSAFSGGAVGEDLTLYASWNMAYAEGLQFTAFEDGWEVSIGTAADNDIVIPALYHGKRVIRIAESGFKETDITSVNIPEFITEIGAEAFYNCASLAAVDFQDCAGLEGIYDRAFYGCSALTAVDLSGHTSFSFKTLDAVYGGEVFGGCTGLETVDFSGCTSLTEITKNAFIDCGNLQTVDFSGCTSLTSIGNGAFAVNEALTQIIIPDTVTAVGYGAFSDCLNLTVFSLAVKQPDSWNSNWNSDGCPAYFYSPDDTMDYGWRYVEQDGELVPKPWEVTHGMAYTAVEGGYEAAYGGADGGSAISIPALYNGEPVVRIANGGFSGKNNINSVELPKYLTEIGNNAFDYCYNLYSVVFPDSLTTIGERAFYWCGYNLTSVDLSKTKVTEIENGTFENCYKLQTALLPAGLTAFGSRAFYTCQKLESIDLSGGLFTTIGESTFENCSSLAEIKFPASLTTIGNSALINCDKLTTVDLSGFTDLKVIGNSAFLSCDNLAEVILPDGLTTIGSEAFKFCGNLKSIIIPENVTSIGAGTFSYCHSDMKVFAMADSFPASDDVGRPVYWYSPDDTMDYGWRYVEQDGKSVPTPWGVTHGMTYTAVTGGYEVNMGGVTATEIVIPKLYKGEHVVRIADNGFTRFPGGMSTEYYFEDGGKTAMENDAMVSISIPETVTSIGNYAFYGRGNLTQITLPEGLTSLGGASFKYCYKLASIVIPGGVTQIGGDTFRDCGKLASVTLPAGLKGIGNWAFSSCGSLESIVIPQDTYVDDRAFTSCPATIFAKAVSFEESGWHGGFNWHPLGESSPVYWYSEDDTMADGWRYVADETTGELVPKPWEVTNGMAYAEVEGGYEVALGGVTAAEIVIPKLYKGEPVVRIADNGFNKFPGGLDPEDYFDGGGKEAIQSDAMVSISIPETVTSIGNYAFYGRGNLTQITLPNGLTSLGGASFKYCLKLTSIVIPEGVSEIGGETFSDCGELASVTLPEGLESIGNDAFWGCGSLTGITLPEGLKSIGDYAFANCVNLESIVIPSGTYVGDSAFYCCFETIIFAKAVSFEESGWHVWFNENVFDIPGGPVYWYSQDDTMADGWRYVEQDGKSVPKPWEVTNGLAYEYIEGYDSYIVSYGNNVTETEIVIPALYKGKRIILVNSFEGKSITSVYIPKYIRIISQQAFYNCGALTEVDFSDCAGLEYIASYAFANCGSLTEIDLSGHTSLRLGEDGAGTFGGCSNLERVDFSGCTALEGMPRNAFEGCGNLRTVNLSGCTAWAWIGSNAFKDCTSLTEIDFSGCTAWEGVSRLAFYNCALTEILIPATVTGLHEYAFQGSNLTIFSLAAKQPDSWNANWNPDGRPVYWYSPDGTMDYGWRYVADETTGELVPTPWDVTNGMTYTAVDGGGYEVALGGVTAAEIVIPKLYKGEPVVRIADNGFTRFPGGMYLEDYNHGGREEMENDDMVSISIPETVTSIGSYAFYGRGNLTQITLPEGLTSLGGASFMYCLKLTSIVIPGGVTQIGGETFSDCEKLASVTLPAGLESIGNYAFWGCGSLTGITLPEGLKSIGGLAFANCGSLESIVIPSGTYVGDRAFFCCYETIIFAKAVSFEESGWHDMFNWPGGPVYWYSQDDTMADGWRYVEQDGKSVPKPWEVTNGMAYAEVEGGYEVALGGVTATEIVIPKLYKGKPVVRIADNGFNKYSAGTPDEDYERDEMMNDGLVSISIPNTVTSAGNSAFRGRGSLRQITLPEGLTSLGEKAFRSCFNLVSIVIPDGVTEIGVETFKDCENLQSITLPANLTSIGNTAFNSCVNLESITLPKGLESIGSTAFDGCAKLESIVIPSGTHVAAYGLSYFPATIFAEAGSFEESGWANGFNTSDYYGNLGPVYWYSPDERKEDGWKYVENESGISIPTPWNDIAE